MIRFSGQVLHGAQARAEALVLDEPLSFWGGYDPGTGIVLDHNHPQSGQCLSDKILLLPATRGSSGSPGCIAETLRLGAAPAAIMMVGADINVAVGAMVAERIYGKGMPVIAVRREDFERIRSGDPVHIEPDGTVTVEKRSAQEESVE